MMHARFALLLCCAALAEACSETTDPGLVSLAGCWNETGNVPGSSLVLQLSESQKTINGTGTFAIEAGASGNLTVTGTRTGSQFALELFYDFGDHRSFLGILRSQVRFDAYQRNELNNFEATPIPFRRCE